MMNRRQALKNIGYTTGFLVATPTILSLLQSCAKEEQLAWQPQLLSEDEAKMLTKVVDLIIPETENIPGAKSLNVPMFIDKYIATMAEDEQISMFKEAAGVILTDWGIGEDKSISKVTDEEYHALLSKYLKASKDERESYMIEMQKFATPEEMKNMSKDLKMYMFLTSVRDLTIFGYKTNEEIGENVLAYDPVPGEQIGCETTEKLTQGKAWSL